MCNIHFLLGAEEDDDEYEYYDYDEDEEEEEESENAASPVQTKSPRVMSPRQQLASTAARVKSPETPAVSSGTRGATAQDEPSSSSEDFQSYTPYNRYVCPIYARRIRTIALHTIGEPIGKGLTALWIATWPNPRPTPLPFSPQPRPRPLRQNIMRQSRGTVPRKSAGRPSTQAADPGIAHN